MYARVLTAASLNKLKKNVAKTAGLFQIFGKHGITFTFVMKPSSVELFTKLRSEERVWRKPSFKSRRGLKKVSEHSKEVGSWSEKYKAVPNSMRERDAAITFEENHTTGVHTTTQRQFRKAGEIVMDSLEKDEKNNT